MQVAKTTSCIIALGSNLADPVQQVQQAVAQIQQLPQTSVTTISNWYQSKAVGPGEQPDYINGAIEILTSLAPLTLLKHLQTIENDHQRVRTIRWGARTLDLDILLYGDCVINEPELSVPHPRMLERNFVIFPLYDLNPDRILPNGKSVHYYKNTLTDTGLHLVDGISSPTMLDRPIQPSGDTD
jgi:2-amino-4-hydroxy-6-hydroxymethyldihydropteridine diphosphokinase